MEQTNLTSLWIRIENFDIDGRSVSLSFEAKLSKSHGWSRGFARRAVEEYKRFVFLAMVAGHPVTPSKIVDKVWHMHLTYTRSYWERMVKDVLPRPLHHEPTTGGRDDDSKHTAQYFKTLESYVRFFGTPPPTDIWPNPGAASVSRGRGRSMLAGTSVLAAAILGGCAPMVAQGNMVLALWVIGGLVGLGGLAFFAYQMFSSGAGHASPDTAHFDPNDPRRREEGADSGCAAASTTIPFDERAENRPEIAEGGDTGLGDFGTDGGGLDSGSDSSGCSSCSS